MRYITVILIYMEVPLLCRNGTLNDPDYVNAETSLGLLTTNNRFMAQSNLNYALGEHLAYLYLCV